MYLVLIFLFLFLTLMIFSPCLSNNKYDFYENHNISIDNLTDVSLNLYQSKISQLSTDICYNDFTVYEIINRDISWLNKFDSLDQSEIFGFNKHDEPLRFVLNQSSINSNYYLTPELYRANRWCTTHNNPNSICPHKTKPLTDLANNSNFKWQYLVNASTVELNNRFQQVYSTNPNYDKMINAFAWFSNKQADYFKNEYDNTSQTYLDYLENVKDLDNSPKNNALDANSFITDNDYNYNNSSDIFNYYGGVSSIDTNTFSSCSDMSFNDNTSLFDNYKENPNGFMFNISPYPFSNPSVGGSCANLDINGDKTKVCFFK